MESVDLFADSSQHEIQVPEQSLLVQVEKVYVLADPRPIEEAEQLLVPEHLQRRLAQQRDKERRPGHGRTQGKADR